MSLTKLSPSGNSLKLFSAKDGKWQTFFYSVGKEDLHIRGPPPIVTNGSIPEIIQSSGKQLWGWEYLLDSPGKGLEYSRMGITNNLLFKFFFFRSTLCMYAPVTLLASLIATLLSL
jgi:hypothetical protein